MKLSTSIKGFLLGALLAVVQAPDHPTVAARVAHHGLAALEVAGASIFASCFRAWLSQTRTT